MLKSETEISYMCVRTCDIGKMYEHLTIGFELIYQDKEVTQVATRYPLDTKYIDLLMLQHTPNYGMSLHIRKFTETDVTTESTNINQESYLDIFKRYISENIDNYLIFKLNLATGDSDGIRSID